MTNQKVYIVIEEHSLMYHLAFSTREKAQAYIDADEEEYHSRLARWGLVIEEAELDRTDDDEAEAV